MYLGLRKIIYVTSLTVKLGLRPKTAFVISICIAVSYTHLDVYKRQV